MITNRGRRKRQAGGQETTMLSGECPCDPDLKMAKQNCVGAANSDDMAFTDIDTLRDDNGRSIASLPSCPPTKAHLRISTEFEPFSAPINNMGDCHRSMNTFEPIDITIRPYVFVSVCCYDSNG